MAVVNRERERWQHSLYRSRSVVNSKDRGISKLAHLRDDALVLLMIFQAMGPSVIPLNSLAHSNSISRNRKLFPVKAAHIFWRANDFWGEFPWIILCSHRSPVFAESWLNEPNKTPHHNNRIPRVARSISYGPNGLVRKPKFAILLRNPKVATVVPTF